MSVYTYCARCDTFTNWDDIIYTNDDEPVCLKCLTDEEFHFYDVENTE